MLPGGRHKEPVEGGMSDFSPVFSSSPSHAVFEDTLLKKSQKGDVASVWCPSPLLQVALACGLQSPKDTHAVVTLRPCRGGRRPMPVEPPQSDSPSHLSEVSSSNEFMSRELLDTLVGGGRAAHPTCVKC